jgi:hypothetical protein
MVNFSPLLIGLVVLFLPLYSLVISLILGKWRFFDNEKD